MFPVSIPFPCHPHHLHKPTAIPLPSKPHQTQKQRERKMMGNERTEHPNVCSEEIGKAKDTKGRKKAGAAVKLQGYVNSGDSPAIAGDCDPAVCRTKSLTDEDLEDLKGCFDLGFSFSYEEIPELCGTLPALELCYSMSRSLSVERAGGEDSPLVTLPRVANWKISSPGDHPDEVKARLKYWAQAVACTVRLCS